MSHMHVESPVCQCSAPQSYPFRCDCLSLDILSEQMHAIARAEPLIVNSELRDYDREVMIAAWRHSQLAAQNSADCSACEPTVSSAVRGTIGMAKAYIGIGAVDRQTAETRYATCQACSRNNLGQCRVCGCFVAAKVRNRNEQCPIAKW